LSQDAVEKWAYQDADSTPIEILCKLQNPTDLSWQRTDAS